MFQVLVLQGPNLDRLGQREPALYGAATLQEVQDELDAVASALGVGLRHVQSAHEGALVDAVHAAFDDGFDGALVNAGAYTHTSIALRDALLASPLPFIEVHLSNVYKREGFRHHSMLAEIASGLIVGLGPAGYPLALRGLLSVLAAARADVMAGVKSIR